MKALMMVMVVVPMGCMDDELCAERVDPPTFYPEDVEIQADCSACRLLAEPMRSICFDQPGCKWRPRCNIHRKRLHETHGFF